MSSPTWNEPGPQQPRPEYWLFSPMWDLLAFGGSAILAIGLALWWQRRGGSTTEMPEWAWLGSIVLVDVAHVYATAFRVYFVPTELRRRPWLYFGIPILGYILGVAIYSESPIGFWRTLAYLAVFHFVRQQYGWVALYRRKRNEQDRPGWWVDALTIYLATIAPLVYWHANLPRRFWWFVPGDFSSVPEALGTGFVILSWAALAAYAFRAAWRWYRGRFLNPGKDLVVFSTFACWHLGIVTWNSDFAFAVTNVLIHGVPYFVLIYWSRWKWGKETSRHATAVRRVFVLLATVWLFALLEEMFWDRTLWHEHAWLFGVGRSLGPWEQWTVPLLAVPQLTHYLLDAFLWRRPDLKWMSARN